MRVRTILALCSTLLLAGPASAATMYGVESAEADSYAISSAGHSLWIPDVSTDLDFDPGASLMLTEDAWHLTGVVRDGAIAFEVDFTYSQIMDYETAHALDPSTPKYELDPSAYVHNGGPVDPGTWLFAGELTGTLTGLDGSTYQGALLEVDAMGPMGQLGEGANGKNVLYGLSNWMTVSVVEDGYGEEFDEESYRGDVNVNAAAHPAPEPTGALAFALGTLVLRWGTRRRSR